MRHPIEPVYDENSKVLILGSFPSVRSREAGFFYGHPQNRFWKVLSAVFDCREPGTVMEKRQMLLSCRVALWDVIASCTVTGSADSSIRDVVSNDLTPVLECADIERIFVNGRTAQKYYKKYIEPVIQREAICLPSTSPANAAWSLDRLITRWRAIRPREDNLL